MNIEAQAIRDGKWWIAFFEIDGRQHGTQAKSLKRLEYMVKDAAALLTEKSPDSFNVTIRLKDPRLAGLVAGYSAASAAEAAASKELASASREAVSVMRGKNMSMEDIGTLLGITKGRVSQLAKT
ncbi:sigma factor-like helix-turn-helix DNA-binding protein [Varibaculum cambriense]|uniref:sigma factor-like helix-turn-helix DNA-binding protein n=1 Tax=Varibaculum cambriense TaxID=184870 RepID=UPI002914E77D|nr:sigma factor-like helix-turn-helix DNA-binding protein [Varibaculum cambriense]MDU3273762.1 sigma factor-like helix-turn-helix DNA-binding protein [Varibaculum cambriense]